MQLRLALAAALLALAAAGQANDVPVIVATERLAVVEVDGGSVAGRQAEDALVFRGIPFAAPPLGQLRWRAPQPVVPWEGVRYAVATAPACLQHLENGGWNRAQYLYAGEDCLTLDVRTPSLSGKLPVMVWIHGGSNRAGSSGGPADSNMTDQGVVHVGLQYRLGPFGFLSHPALTSEQGGASGNYGLMDQIAALRWVRDNIAKFGGDPGNVTIYGESAGSQDTSLLLAAPEAQGLFHKAILQSGTPGFGVSFRSLAEAEALGVQLDRLAGAEGHLDTLRKLSPNALIDLAGEIGEPASQGNGMLFLRTTIDGNVLPDAPDRLIAGNAPVPVIIGTDTVEFGPGSDNDVDLLAHAETWFPGHGAEALAAYRAESADPRRAHIAMRIQSDGEFHCPADRTADLLAKNGWPVWRYEFDVGPDGGFTRHAYEIGFVFGRQPVGGGVQMQDYWAALAIDGDPNGDTAISQERPQWERWDPNAPRQMAFGEDATQMEAGKPRAQFCAFAEAY